MYGCVNSKDDNRILYPQRFFQEKMREFKCTYVRTCTYIHMDHVCTFKRQYSVCEKEMSMVYD